jgi:hypothetical protein
MRWVEHAAGLGGKKGIQKFELNPEGKNLRVSGRRWENNIKMD